MRVGHFKFGWFTDKDQCRTWKCLAHLGNGINHPQTGCFLIITQHQMHGLAQRRLYHLGYHRQGNGRKSFHIDRATAVSAILCHTQSEGIMRPVLSFNWHHIGMA